MTGASSLTPDEIRAAAATHHEIGSDYQSAVIENFLEKIGREIDARVDARMAHVPPAVPPAAYPPAAYPPARVRRDRTPFVLAIVSMVLGVPLSAIVVAAGPNPVGLPGLAVVWIVIAVINVAYARHIEPPSGDR